MNRVIAALLLSATLAPASASSAAPGAEGGPSLRWVDRSGHEVVELVGLDDARLKSLERLAANDWRWTAIMPVRVFRPAGEPEATPMLGQYSVTDGVVRFRPRYPLRSGMQYIAQFHPVSIDAPNHPAPAIISTHIVPKATGGPRGTVTAVYPSGDILPENVLKFYVHFSTPMARGEAYRRVRLEDGSGRAVERPFLEIGEELWDPQGRRLTLLLDPGRIKRGLVPREEEGPILEEGKAYTLSVDPGWPDAEGRPLAEGFRRSFRTGPPDSSQPVPSRWSITPGRPGTRDTLVVRFPEPLDHAMLGRALTIEVSGLAVRGRGEVGTGDTSWSFTPDAAWPTGPAALRVDTELEDLAGNSVARPFEVDVFRQPSREDPPPRITVPIPQTVRRQASNP